MASTCISADEMSTFEANPLTANKHVWYISEADSAGGFFSPLQMQLVTLN